LVADGANGGSKVPKEKVVDCSGGACVLLCGTEVFVEMHPRVVVGVGGPGSSTAFFMRSEDKDDGRGVVLEEDATECPPQ
jgi:hypothetical protein